VRISELCDRASVPIATVEYYQREHLIDLPSEKHGYRPQDVRRLRLVRVLVEVGGLTPREVRTLFKDMSDTGGTPHKTFGLVLRTLEGADAVADADAAPVDDEAVALARRLAERHGWRMDAQAANWAGLVKLLRTLLWLDAANAEGVVEAYASAAERITDAELRVMGLYADEEALIERLVLWTVFGDPLMASLHRISRLHGSQRVFDDEFSPADRGSTP
jgi:DNA-binding transcriptional MerR regulator